jgi:nucleotide-binding universal stress UspA family protein
MLYICTIKLIQKLMENTEKKILVPVDFSEHSLAGLEQSYSFARFSDAEIVLLHILTEANANDNKYYEDIKNKFNDFAKLVAEKSGLNISYRLEKGKLIETIIDISDKINATMIVVGTTDPKGIMQKVLGGNDLKLIREAKCPVVTLKGEKARPTCKNIVVPLDLSKETGQKVAKAISLAKFFGGRVYAVTAVTTNIDYDQEKLRTQLNQVKKMVTNHGIECETKYIKASGGNEKVASTLLEYANSVDGDLMLIMTQQEAEFVEFFVGSLAKEIIHKATIPILSIIPRAKRK